LSPVEIPSDNLDLDLRLEKRRAPEVAMRRQLLRWNVWRMIEGFSNQLRRQHHITLRETHQREAWLRIPPRLLRREERFLRTIDVSLAQPNSTQFGQRPSKFPTEVRTKVVTRPERFLPEVAVVRLAPCGASQKGARVCARLSQGVNERIRCTVGD